MGSKQGLPSKSRQLSAIATAGIFVLATTLALSPARAQTAVTVQVSVDKPINVMTAEAMGVYTDLYDANTSKPSVAAYMHTAGMYTLQFPGGYGSYADLYHWSTNSGSKFANFTKDASHFYPGEAAMAHMVGAIDKTGAAVITVNYGTNLAGTGGGEPAEAAAWVAYFNGDSASTAIIGKDSTGQDWKTVGYWATLRAQAPLTNDDGLNLLRANHPKPLAIKLWQIGSEVYNNGFYGGDHKSEVDMHAPYPPKEADNERRRKNPSLSPTFYGERINEFAKAMKDVDPTVWVGATLNLAPIDSSWGSDWNPSVLKAACRNIEFVSFVWRPDYRSGPAYNVRDDAGTLRAPEEQLGKILSETIYDAKKNCPSDHIPRVAFTQVAPIHWAKVVSPLADGLFAADAFALLIESGTINSDWNELHDGYLFNGDSIPGPAFYGIQMLHIVAFRPGDNFVTATSTSSMVAAHSVLRSDGSFGLLLINKDPNQPAEVKVNIAGGAFASQGSRFDYGPDNLKGASPVTKTAFKSGGSSFAVTIAPYTITDIVLAKAQ
jgi:hypothetical protein